jgi:hypothetical protein
MNCSAAVKDLVGRGNEICKLVQPLVGKARVAYSKSLIGPAIVFATFSGPLPDRPIDEWRFTTFVPSIRGAYRERWLPADSNRKRYYLQQAYLHLYLQLPFGGQEDEILALHCDPNEDDGEPHAVYKKGPHVHVTAAPQPLRHSHFALNLSDLPTVLSSLPRLHGAFSTAVIMLQEQVLEVYKSRA